MDVPPEIAFRSFAPTPALKDLIEEGIASLEKVHPRLVSCRVMVEEVSGGFIHVRLDIGIPGGEIVINRDAPADATVREASQALREAFDVARRQLRERKKRRSADARRGDRAPQGRVLRLVTDTPGNRYGFLLSDDGREVYFDEGVVREISFDDLEEGMELHFSEGSGKEGARASSVSPLTAAAPDEDEAGAELAERP